MKSLFPFLIDDDGVLKKYLGLGINVVIPETVKRIGCRAFFDNKTVRKITIMQGTAIEDEAFWKCVNLREIVLPPDLKELPNNVFTDCRNLETVVLPEGMQEIGKFAFQSCHSLKRIVIPESVRLIGNYAFVYCHGLSEVVLHPGLEEIGDGAFNECESLKRMAFPSTLKRIGKKAFAECFSLVEISGIPDSAEIDVDAFLHCKVQVASRVIEKKENVPIKSYSAVSSRATQRIAEEPVYDQEPIMYFSGKILSDVKNIVRRLEIPEGTTGIYSSALSGRTKEYVEEIVLPSTMVSINSGAFQKCPRLRRVVLNEGLREISSFAFRNCPSLSEINFPDSLQDVDPDAFLGCPDDILPEKYLKEKYAEFYIVNNELRKVRTGDKEHIVVPEGIKRLWGSAFWDVRKTVKTVELPESMKILTSSVFMKSEALVSVKLPRGLRIIESYAFKECPNLRSIDFGDKIISCARNAFDDTQKIKIPEKIRQVMDNPSAAVGAIYHDRDIPDDSIIRSGIFFLGGCEIMTNYTMPGGIQRIGKGALAFFDLCNVVLPDKLLDIGEDAFAGCFGLISVTLPDTLLSIGKEAFLGCFNLKSINIPESIRFIDPDAFKGCDNLVLPDWVYERMDNNAPPSDNTVELCLELEEREIYHRVFGADVIYAFLSQSFHIEIDTSAYSIKLIYKKLEKSEMIFKKNNEELKAEIRKLLKEMRKD